MKYKMLTVMLLILITAVLSSAQTSYKGLKPGMSRKVEVERVLGQPVKQLSETLVEYRPQPLAGRIYVQYRADTSVVERLEFICRQAESNCKDFMKSLNLSLPENPDATPPDDKGRYRAFSPPPSYLVLTMEQTGANENEAVRVAFYSRELYEAEASKAEKVSEATAAKNDEAATMADRRSLTTMVDATAATITRDGDLRPAYLTGAYGEVTGIVKVRAADGSVRPAAFATVDFYRTDPNFSTHFTTKTNQNGAFQVVGLSQTGVWVVVISGPGLTWTYADKLRTPTTVEIITKPGDGLRPTVEQVMAAIQ